MCLTSLRAANNRPYGDLAAFAHRGMPVSERELRADEGIGPYGQAATVPHHGMPVPDRFAHFRRGRRPRRPLRGKKSDTMPPSKIEIQAGCPIIHNDKGKTLENVVFSRVMCLNGILDTMHPLRVRGCICCRRPEEQVVPSPQKAKDSQQYFHRESPRNEK